MEEEGKVKEEESVGFGFLFVILGVLFLPTFMGAGILYFIFFKQMRWNKSIRYRPRFLVCTSLLISAIMFLTLLLLHYDFLSNGFLGLWLNTAFLSFLIFSFFVLYRAWQLKITPELRHIKGWAYQISFAPTPFDKMKRKRLKKKIEEGELDSKDACPLGILDGPITVDTDEVYEKIEPVFATYQEALKTRFISGGTGSGKTSTILTLIHNDIEAGYPVIAIDFKKTADFAYNLSRMAKEYKRPFYHFIDGKAGSYVNPFCKYQASYDPVSTKDIDFKVEMLLGLRQWDTASEVYRNRTKYIITILINLIEEVRPFAKELPNLPWDEGDLSLFLATLKTENVDSMIHIVEREIAKKETPTDDDRRNLTAYHEYYQNLTMSRSEDREQINGLMKSIQNLLRSGYKDWLIRGNSPLVIDLDKLILDTKKSPIILFQFTPNVGEEIASQLGHLVLADIKRMSAEKQKRGDTRLVGLYVDEFQTLTLKDIKGIVEKVRSAGIFPTLSVQSIQQLVENAGDNAQSKIDAFNETIGTVIIHAGAVNSTSLLAQFSGAMKRREYRVVGKRESSFFSMNLKNQKKASVQTSLVDSFRVTAEEIQGLSYPKKSNHFHSQAYYITKSCSDPKFANCNHPIVKKVWVIPYKDTLKPVPDDFLKGFQNEKVIHPPKSKKKAADGNLIDITEESMISDKEFVKKFHRKDLEKEVKQTTFDKMSGSKKKKFALPKVEEKK